MSFAQDGRATFEMVPGGGGRGSCTSAGTGSAATRSSMTDAPRPRPLGAASEVSARGA
jgi:hypothetical protein